MNIAVIGSGNIGRVLAEAWQAAGHTVTIGARDPHSPKAQAAVKAAGGTLGLAPIAAALSAAEVVLLAIPGAAVAAFGAEHGAACAGKIVIDATNQFGQPVLNGLASLASHAPEASLVRAFNSLGWENFAAPAIDGVPIDLLYCSPAGATQTTIAQLIADCGLRPIYVGGLDAVALVDSLGALWGALVFGQGYPRRLAFKIQTEPA